MLLRTFWAIMAGVNPYRTAANPEPMDPVPPPHEIPPTPHSSTLAPLSHSVSFSSVSSIDRTHRTSMAIENIMKPATTYCRKSTVEAIQSQFSDEDPTEQEKWLLPSAAVDLHADKLMPTWKACLANIQQACKQSSLMVPVKPLILLAENPGVAMEYASWFDGLSCNTRVVMKCAYRCEVRSLRRALNLNQLDGLYLGQLVADDYVVDGLLSTGRLKVLSMEVGEVEKMMKLFGALRAQTTITHLVVSNPRSKSVIDDAIVESIVLLITENSRITNFNFELLRLGPSGMHILSRCLNNAQHVRSLLLPWNVISNDGVKHLADAMIDKVFLRELNIASNGIGDESAGDISSIISKCPHLLILNLSNNLLGDNAMTLISNALEGAHHLRKLDLNSNAFTEKSLKNLGEILQNHNHLRELNLNGINIGTDGMEVLLAYLRENLIIRKVEVDDKSIHIQKMNELNEILARNRNRLMME